MHHLGEMLSTPLRLLRLMEHIRSENQYELYKLQDVNSGENYEVKVYDLHGLPKAQRNRRVKSLKRDTASPSRYHTFHLNDKHYLVFPQTQHREETPVMKFGAIGRRNSAGYKAAFPLLPGCKPVVLPHPVKKSRL
jgi:hypothetical protein